MRFPALLLCMALGTSQLPCRAQMSFAEEQAFARSYLASGRSADGEPERVKPISAAVAAKNYPAAIELADALLVGGDDADESPQYNAFIRSLALYYRADARSRSGGAWAAVWADLRSAAQLGNVRATRASINAWQAMQNDQQAAGGFAPPPTDIARTYAIAADLGMNDGIAALAQGPQGSALPPSERLYWRLRLALMPTAEGATTPMARLIEKEGEQVLGAALARHASVGGPFSATAAGLPGRDVAATLYAEDRLRRIVVASFGFRSPRVKTGTPPTVLEDFRFQALQTAKVGMANLLLLVPGPASGPKANVVRMPREGVAAEARAGDKVWVTCGALSHTAEVFDIDRARDVVRLVDATWEFWQPSHNDCITAFAHERTAHGFYVVALKWSQLVPIIDAVGSLRSAEFIGTASAGGALSMRSGISACRGSLNEGDGLVGAPLEALERSALVRTFGLERHGSVSLADNARGWRFAPSTPYLHGQAGLLALADVQGCVRALSLTLRTTLLENPSTHRFGVDLVQAFFKFGRVEGAPQEGASEALEGKRPSFEQASGQLLLRIENFESADGGALQRTSLR